MDRMKNNFMLNFKIYPSDEGYCHIVRQRSILEKLNDYSNDPIDFTLQKHNHLKAAKDIFGKGNFIGKYNNISWQKLENGSLDLCKIKKHYKDYDSKSIDFINVEKNLSEKLSIL